MTYYNAITCIVMWCVYIYIYIYICTCVNVLLRLQPGHSQSPAWRARPSLWAAFESCISSSRQTG